MAVHRSHLQVCFVWLGLHGVKKLKMSHYLNTGRLHILIKILNLSWKHWKLWIHSGVYHLAWLWWNWQAVATYQPSLEYPIVHSPHFSLILPNSTFLPHSCSSPGFCRYMCLCACKEREGMVCQNAEFQKRGTWDMKGDKVLCIRIFDQCEEIDFKIPIPKWENIFLSPILISSWCHVSRIHL